ncbi:MAG TPA: ParB/RepB/Spo0J family partition protein [Anaerolineae bacterium]|nr:ParB/RepB/Spo0J family partition protein [Anaerolineae bacterium]
MAKKRALGRGLGALIPGSDPAKPSEVSGEGLRQVPVKAIVPNPHQPRTAWDEEALENLTASIKEHGLIQPLLVREEESGQYTLIAGERRWRASQRAGLEVVPVVVKEATPQAMLEIAIIENVQRADLNALEEALAYQQLMEEFDLTQAQVAERVGKSRSTIANFIRLLQLPVDVQEAVVQGQISNGHARALLSLPTAEAQRLMLRTVLNLGLSVRQTESAVAKMLAGSKPKPKEAPQQSVTLAALETEFQSSLGTKVKIKAGAKGKGGQVIIHYYSDEDLQAIYEAITQQ